MPGLIHVVDDDASFRKAIERRLKLAGYEVATYPSAQQLLERLPDNSEAGCILLDVRIPGMNGPELQSRLSDLGITLPIVFLSGHADTATTVRAIKAGAEDFLTKSVSSEQLIDAIERAMARHDAARIQRSKLDSFRAHVATLTPRERQVFELIVRGKINKAARYARLEPQCRQLMHEADPEGALAIEPCFSKVHAPTKRYRPDDVRTDVTALYREKLGRQVPGEHPCTKGQYESLLTTAIAGLR